MRGWTGKRKRAALFPPGYLPYLSRYSYLGAVPSMVSISIFNLVYHTGNGIPRPLVVLSKPHDGRSLLLVIQNNR